MSSNIKPLSKGDQALLDHLTEIFAEHGGSMTAAKFDEVFTGKEFGTKDGPHCQGWNNDDILWGDMGGSDWACWLSLLQYAIDAGVASYSGETVNSAVYYLPAASNRKWLTPEEVEELYPKRETP